MGSPRSRTWEINYSAGTLEEVEFIRLLFCVCEIGFRVSLCNEQRNRRTIDLQLDLECASLFKWHVNAASRSHHHRRRRESTLMRLPLIDPCVIPAFPRVRVFICVSLQQQPADTWTVKGRTKLSDSASRSGYKTSRDCNGLRTVSPNFSQHFQSRPGFLKGMLQVFRLH